MDICNVVMSHTDGGAGVSGGSWLVDGGTCTGG